MNTIYVSKDGKKKYESSKEFALHCIDIYRRENDIEAEYEFFYEDSGAPALKVKTNEKLRVGMEKSHDLFISISHSKDYLVAALGDEKIGVDIEVIRDLKYINIAEKFSAAKRGDTAGYLAVENGGPVLHVTQEGDDEPSLRILRVVMDSYATTDRKSVV